MNKADYFAWGQRQARKDWAEGRGYHMPLIGKNWRDAAYRAGYDDAWNALEA